MTTKTEALPEIQEDISEPDGKAHVVRIDALIKGGPVVALCGKKYIPTVIGPEVFNRKACLTCVELYEMLKSMDI